MGYVQYAQRLGFSHVAVGPIFASASNGDVFLTDDFEATDPLIQPAADADATVAALARLGDEAGLALLLDIVLDRVAADGAMARSAPRWFFRADDADIVDPRKAQLGPEALPARFEDVQRTAELIAWWADRLIRLANAGAAGFRLLGLATAPAHFVRAVIAGVKRECPQCLFLGWTPGIDWTLHAEFEGIGLDAAATGDGLFLPMGYEFGARRRMDARFQTAAATGTTFPAARADRAFQQRTE